MTNCPIILIEFLDHSGQQGWFDPANIKGIIPERCKAVGWLIRQTKDVYYLAGLKADNGHYGNIEMIMKGTVKKCKILQR